MVETTSPASTFLSRHDFLLRRLHSLSGLIPVGAYMVIHLLTNASVNVSNVTFQKLVTGIHSLGPTILPIVEWTFIFIPILFHAIFGVIIIRGGLPNHSTYRYTNNIRYSLQRATGMIAFAFIVWHVFHMHGWFHFDPWLNAIEPLGGAQFRPYNAASTAAEAMQSSIVVQILYLVGVLSCVFHLANGIWTMGITWGLWVTPLAQRRADYVALVLGLLLAVVGVAAQVGLLRVNVPTARQEENKFYEHGVAAGDILPDEHKRYHAKDANIAQGDELRHAGEGATDVEPPGDSQPPADAPAPGGDETAATATE